MKISGPVNELFSQVGTNLKSQNSSVKTKTGQIAGTSRYLYWHDFTDEFRSSGGRVIHRTSVITV